MRNGTPQAHPVRDFLATPGFNANEGTRGITAEPE